LKKFALSTVFNLIKQELIVKKLIRLEKEGNLVLTLETKKVDQEILDPPSKNVVSGLNVSITYSV